MKWMSTPSIVVTNCGRAFSFDSASPSRSPCPNSALTPGASRAARPASESSTVSRSGQRVAAIRRRRSVSAASGTWARKVRMASAAERGGVSRWAAAVTGENAARAAIAHAAEEEAPGVPGRKLRLVYVRS